MEIQTAVAVVGIGAVMPDAHNAGEFWQNILNKKYSIGEVPASRWLPDLFYHPDPNIPDKTYSKIGGWVHDFPFTPLKWGILIPPKVLDNMDASQKWAIAASRQALMDYGFPERPLDTERVAVILGNAMAGEHHYQTNLRIHAPEFSKALANLPAFQSLPGDVQTSLLNGMLANIQENTPPINEDTMPGELSNIIAGRVANVFNFGGANFVTDAACASSLAALQSAVEGLIFHKFDAVLTGGIDRNMGPGSFVKFSKVGALSPDGSRPYAAGANGFVMGEGAAVLLLKRLADAERDGDKIYAVVRGIGSSSDGKGKGITAPNPIGQERAVERAWKNAGVAPSSVGLIEGHGTSTRVGDRVEIQSLAKVFNSMGLANHTVGLGSVKSNIGHLKSAAGAAGLVKAIYALDKKVLPPSANFNAPNPEIDFAHMPFFVVTEQQPWERPTGDIRRAGVSSFGFGGTNFHVVLEEYVPGIASQATASIAIHNPQEQSAPAEPEKSSEAVMAETAPQTQKPQFVFLSDTTAAGIKSQLEAILDNAKTGTVSASSAPNQSALEQPDRLVISFSDTDDFLKKAPKALSGLENDAETPWNAFTARGIYRGSGSPGQIAFLFPGQGSQYANMLKDLADTYPVVKQTFEEADQIMTPLLGKPLTDYIFTDVETEERIQEMEEALKDTTITQPAVLTANIAILRLLAQHNITPDALIGHSLGEYAALVAAGALSFGEALEVVSARGHAMAALKVEDNGCMAAVLAPIEEVEKIIATIDGYVVLANVNSPVQSVIGGNVAAVESAIEKFKEAGRQAVKIPVSHAFHTRIVAPAADILREMIEKTDLKLPALPIAANVTGEFYPQTRDEMVNMLAEHIASPVQFVKGVRALYQSGCRIFIESGPKRVLNSLAKDILKEMEDATVIATNHPRKGGVESFHEALCQAYALGLGFEKPIPTYIPKEIISTPAPSTQISQNGVSEPQPISGSVVISGAGLGLPGRSRHVFNDDNIERILNGESFIEPLPTSTREEMLAKKVTRLEKSDAGAQMVVLDDLDQTIKLAGQHGIFDLGEEFGVPADRVAALDISTQLAIAAGIEALRDAGIPLMMRYKQTSTGSYLPDRWMLPPSLADETGVIFGSAFPGLDELSAEAERYYQHKQTQTQLDAFRQLLPVTSTETQLYQTLQEKISRLEEELNQLDYHFDRKFIFRVLNMGHSQFAEYIGARGPNTALNAACATTTHAISIAEDWIRSGRAKRVVIVSGDDVTGGSLVNWVGTGLLATGATTTEGDLHQAALPFDRRRNGMIMGMGAAGLVVESEDSVRERGMQGIVELLATDTANSAFHGTRLNVGHVSQVMQRLIEVAEKRFGLSRSALAAKTMFMSHETYTPARGGSAAAEIDALKSTFGDAAEDILIANTKGFTGHTMGVGIEDVVAVKALERGIVPPIANIHNNFEPDPQLGNLKLSQGGPADVQYALRLGAGFGSQISMTLLRKIPAAVRVDQPTYQRWLDSISGQQNAELRIDKRTLRVKDRGVPVQEPASSHWKYGQGPSLWAAYPDVIEAQSQPKVPQVSTQVDPQPVQGTPVLRDKPTEEEIKTFLLGLVSEKTGYPAEILEMDLDLEADLGIDTVKQAELFSAVRDHFNIPRREDLTLVDYNTLQKVVEFVQDSLTDVPQAESEVPQANETAAQTDPPAPTPEAVSAPVPMPENAPTADQPTEEEIKTFLLGLVSEKTGYPAEILEMDLDLEADLGIDTVKQAELFSAVRDHFNIPRREDLMLVDYNTLQKVVEFVQDSLAELSQTTLEAVPANETAVQGEQTTPAPATLPASTTTPHAPAEEEIKTFLLNLVSEKTGYPLEILEMDLDLEADLGIDTVKQAELFSAVREHYSIPKQEDLMLVDYNTLQKVVEFVQKALEGTSHTSTTQTTPGIEQPAQVEQPSPDPTPTPKRVSNADLPNEEEIKTFLLNLVSEKTGYPPEILEMDLDLEADLGIDTVKQAELFSAVREHYSIPKQEDLMLVDYNTLQKVVEFVQDSLTTPAENTATSAQTYTEVALAEPVEDEQADENRQTIARRVPRPMLLPRTTLCLPTGIQLNEDSRVLVFDDAQGSSDALVHRLIERQVQVLKLTTADLTDISETIQLWLSQGPIHGVYFLPGIGDETPLAAMTADEWDAQLEQTTVALYHIMKALPEEAFLMTATKTGGLHGYTKEKVIFTGSGISGFTKAIKLERPKSLAKVVDFSPKENAATIATQLIEETLHDPSVVEVGLENGQRFGIIVVEQPWSQSDPRSLKQGSVFLVTGGTGGITLPIVQDLANHTQGRFYLTGRSPLPKTDSPDLATLRATGPEGLEQAWMKRLQESGQKFTPLEVRSKVERFVRAATTLEAIEAIQQSGASVEYIVADITSQEDMERVAQDVLEAAGQVDVLIHAAGFERSRKLSKKPLEEFLQTIHVKASGFFYLYQSLRSRNALPKEMVLFSSVAGRFGNNGQTDYSAANDLLSKMGIVIQSQHPGTRVTTIDWGPWAEVGMASRGSTPRLMAFAGIEMLSPDTAAGLVFKEIVQAGGGEVIYAGTLGILEEQLGSENSLDLQAANRALQSGNPPQLMLSKITGFNRQEGATFEVTLDPSEEPFLHDHAVNGTPLLPGVMGIEGFSSVAQHIVNALSANGPTGLQVTELENVEFANPFKFYRNEPRHIIWKTFPIRGSRGLEVQVTMESLNPSRLEQYPKPIQHFTGTVHLTTRSNTSNGLFAPPPKWNGRYTLSEEEIYQLYFHGPSFQVVAGVQRDQNGLLAKFRSDLPPITTQTLSLGATPLLIELCLQTAGIWEIGQTGEMSLPRGIQKVKLYNHEVNGEAVFAKIQPVQTPNGILFNSQVLDSTGKVYLELQGYRTATLPAPMDPTLLEPIRKLLSEE